MPGQTPEPLVESVPTPSEKKGLALAEYPEPCHRPANPGFHTPPVARYRDFELINGKGIQI
jgi:hypothetical protein